MLCVHEDPQWDRVLPPWGSPAASLYGAEYWGVEGLFDTAHNGRQGHRNGLYKPRTEIHYFLMIF